MGAYYYGITGPSHCRWVVLTPRDGGPPTLVPVAVAVYLYKPFFGERDRPMERKMDKMWDAWKGKQVPQYLAVAHNDRTIAVGDAVHLWTRTPLVTFLDDATFGVHLREVGNVTEVRSRHHPPEREVRHA